MKSRENAFSHDFPYFSMIMYKNISVNPYNGKKYILPKKIDDSTSISNFHRINKGKTFVVILSFYGCGWYGRRIPGLVRRWRGLRRVGE